MVQSLATHPGTNAYNGQLTMLLFGRASVEIYVGEGI